MKFIINQVRPGEKPNPQIIEAPASWYGGIIMDVDVYTDARHRRAQKWIMGTFETCTPGES